ncbi:MAG: 4Fe-4S dicluster domain-containing protein, partial [Acetomicrobium sp.]|nr:4Fe-4S dicluster domain-containing protein [Acetomicrobium sp.]
MQKINIITHFDLCTGCKLCQLACSERIFAGYNPHKSLLQIKHHSENLYHFPIVCNQCENAYCSRVCPVDAILRDSFTGAMVVDPDKCIACNLCNIYCP